MQVKIVNLRNFPHFLPQVVQLGDENAKTLGFFPQAAYEDQLRKGVIIGAISNDVLLGYLMFRISFDRVNIVHLCIDEKYRGMHIALKLLDQLKNNTKSYRGIRLKCRQDYKENSFWERANFIPVGEIIGRGKSRNLLTIWWYPHAKIDLFSTIQEKLSDQKIFVVIDTNVFIDIKMNKEQESLTLVSDWIEDEIELCLTSEVFNDIQRNKDKKERTSCRNLAKKFTILNLNEEKYNSIYEILQTKFKPNNSRDKSDLKHIVISIHEGINYFVTRDNHWLKRSDFFEKTFSLRILRPIEFISQMDEILQKSKYLPKKLAGTSLYSKELTSREINIILNEFQCTAINAIEKKQDFRKKIENHLSSPKTNSLTNIVNEKGEIVGLFTIDKSISNQMNVPIIRVSNSLLKNTLFKHLLYKIQLISLREKAEIIVIEETCLEDNLKRILLELKYFPTKNCWIKVNISGVKSTIEIHTKLLKLRLNHPIFQDIFNQLITYTESLLSEFSVADCYQLERLLYPVKLQELNLPCYIIPIRSEWAAYLFEENLQAQKLEMFSDKIELMLNRQNVYYRSAKPKRLNYPSRILWYVSRKKSDKGYLAASSYIEYIDIDNPKNIYKKYENLGIYEWQQIYKLAKKDVKNTIMAFVFKDTELLINKLSLNYLRNRYKQTTEKNFNPISPIKITNELYLELYKRGMHKV